MNNKNAAPLVPLIPVIAAMAPQLLIGGALIAGLVWLFSEDEKSRKLRRKKKWKITGKMRKFRRNFEFQNKSRKFPAN